MKKTILAILLLPVPFWAFSQRYSHGDLQMPTPAHARRGFITVQEAKPLGPVPHAPSIDLQPQLPLPQDQYQQGSCAAWATCYGLMSYLQGRLNNWALKDGQGNVIQSHVYSPSFVYNQLNRDPTCQKGLLLDTVMARLQTMGTVPMADFDYDRASCDKLPTSADETRKVTLMDATTIYNWWAKTSPNQVIDTSEVKDVLNQGYPVVVGVHIDTTFETFFPGEAPQPGPIYIWNTFIDSPVCRWYHAMLCVGYSDKLGAFKLMNSWSTDFGNQGFIWVDYQLFRQTTLEAYYSTLIPAGVNLVKANIKETRKGPIHQIKPQEAGVAVTSSWLQAGTFRTIGAYEISCLYVDKDAQTAMLQIRDIANDRFVRAFLSKKAGDSKQFLHNDFKVGITLNNVSELDNMDTKPTAFFNLTVSPVASH
jgi:Papain family cysteine protease